MKIRYIYVTMIVIIFEKYPLANTTNALAVVILYDKFQNFCAQVAFIANQYAIV